MSCGSLIAREDTKLQKWNGLHIMYYLAYGLYCSVAAITVRYMYCTVESKLLSHDDELYIVLTFIYVIFKT